MMKNAPRLVHPYPPRARQSAPTRPMSSRMVGRWFGVTRVLTSGMISRRANFASHILGGGTLFCAADRGSFDVITRQYIREWIFMPAFVSILLVSAGSTAQHRKHELIKPAKVPALLRNC